MSEDLQPLASGSVFDTLPVSMFHYDPGYSPMSTIPCRKCEDPIWLCAWEGRVLPWNAEPNGDLFQSGWTVHVHPQDHRVAYIGSYFGRGTNDVSIQLWSIHKCRKIDP